MRKSQTGLKKSAFIEAAQAMGSEKGVSEEALLAALVESFRVTFAKKIEDEFRVEKPFGKSKAKETVKLPDALIRTEIDLKKGKIEVYHQWLVVNDDDVQDDYLEIGLEDAKAKNPKLKVGDYYEEELDFNNLNKVDVNRFVSCFRQKISKAEKDALLASFENKIGKIVTADVEKFDDKKVNKVMEQVYDLIHSSPSKSCVAAQSYENDVINKIGELEGYVSSNDKDQAVRVAGEIVSLMEERNRRVRTAH